MRTTLRLFAAVSRSSQFLEAGAPTGLTGLATHGSPRTALIYLYSSTLERLKEFPEHSVYRQSVEALTKHRLNIIESIKPAGLAEWQQRVQPALEEHPEAFRKIPVAGGSDFNIVWKEGPQEAAVEGEGKRIDNSPRLREGPKTDEELEREEKMIAQYLKEVETRVPEIEAEPALTTEQIGEIETKLNAGLIEEIIEVARGELDLAATLLENKV